MKAPGESAIRRVVIAGEYGFGNTGDEAILAATIAALRRGRGGVELTVISGTPERTRSLHGVDAVLWTDHAAIAEALEACDLFVLGGGELFTDRVAAEPQRGWRGPVSEASPTPPRCEPRTVLLPGHGGLPYFAGLVILARLLGRRTFIHSVDVGPLVSADAKALARAAFELADRASVRCTASLEELSELGIRATRGGPIEVVADPAFGLEPAAPEAARRLLESAGLEGGGRYLAISLRPQACDAIGGAEIARALDRVLADTGLTAVFIPYQHEVAEASSDDVRAARRVAELLARPAVVLPTTLPPAVTAAAVGGAALALVTRFHAAVAAIAGRVPSVAIASTPKVRALLEDAGQAQAVLEPEGLTADALTEALLAVWTSREALADVLGGTAGRLAALAARSTARTLELLDRPAGDETSFSPSSETAAFLRALAVTHTLQRASLARDLLAARQALTERDAELERLQEKMASITTSSSWKLVQAVRSTTRRAAPKDSLRQRWMSDAAAFALDARKRGAPGLAKALLPEALEGPATRAVQRVRGLVPHRDVRAHEKELLAIREKHAGAREVVLFVPSIPWDVTLFQRPQQLAIALARLGVLVIYVEPNASKQAPGFHEERERLYLAKVPPEVFARLGDFAAYVVSWNRSYLDRLGECRVIYDYIDELDVFNTPNPDQLARDHERLLAESTVVFATADALHKQVLPARADAVLCPNGVDYEHFARLRGAAIEPPEGMEKIVDAGRPIVGYYGALARWFDYELLWAVASARPDLSFVLIGPDYDKTLEHKGVFHLPNVAWLGPRHYSILPRYLRFFDVATIPFKVNAITHATSPLKLFEYMAGGKPIVTTAMRESMRYENVLVGRNADDFSRQLSRALILGRDAAHLALTDRIARENTWEARAEQLLAELAARTGTRL